VKLDELIDGWEQAWSGRDVTAFAEVCAPDIQYEDPLTSVPCRGPVELGAHARRMWTGFPDARLQSTGARLGDGRYAVAPCKIVGTHTGEVDGLPPSGREVSVHVVFYCELAPYHPRLLRVRGFFDVYGAAVALGVLPRPGTLGERALLIMRGYGVRGLRRS
jgi:hypothetical protein